MEKFFQIQIPKDAAVLVNKVVLKPDVDTQVVKNLIKELCDYVNSEHKKDGFYGGMVLLNTPKVSKEGSTAEKEPQKRELLIITFWKDFDSHEVAHQSKKFTEAFREMTKYVEETHEVLYNVIWVGT